VKEFPVHFSDRIAAIWVRADFASGTPSYLEAGDDLVHESTVLRKLSYYSLFHAYASFYSIYNSVALVRERTIPTE
jgi:hypothetical protein